jgi:hypothetical protein
VVDERMQIVAVDSTLLFQFGEELRLGGVGESDFSSLTDRATADIEGRLHVLGEPGIGHRSVAEPLFVRLRQSEATR